MCHGATYTDADRGGTGERCGSSAAMVEAILAKMCNHKGTTATKEGSHRDAYSGCDPDTAMVETGCTVA